MLLVTQNSQNCALDSAMIFLKFNLILKNSIDIKIYKEAVLAHLPSTLFQQKKIVYIEKSVRTKIEKKDRYSVYKVEMHLIYNYRRDFRLSLV